MKVSVVVALAVAVLVIWYLRRDSAPAPAAAAPPPAAAVSAGPGAPAAAPPSHVQRVSPAERAQLAEKIRTARSGRAAISAPAGPNLPTPAPSLPPARPTLDVTDTATFKTTMRAAMKEVIPFLAECYDKYSKDLPESIEVRAQLTLTGDPDVGTLIDTNGLDTPTEEPLHAGFSVCLRDVLAGLAMPPLAEGQEVQVTYPFVFAR